MEPIRIGVLGCADIAVRRMLPAMLAADDIEVAAVASRDAAKAASTAHRFAASPVHGYAALLDRSDLDAVYVPLPAALHAEWVERALLAGKHVLAEKPLTTELPRTRALLELAADRGLVLLENVMFVHHGQHAAVRRLLADGAIGELRSFRATFTVPRLPDGDIRYQPELGGGALWDTGVYPVRAALHLLGGPLEVLAAASAGREVDTSGAALLRTPQGVTAQLDYGLDHGYRSSYELCGSEGRITVDRAFTPPAGFRPAVRLERRTGAEPVDLPAEDQVAATVAAFAAAVRSGAPADPDLLRQAELLATIRQFS
ncbi:Gfo/Idh/MocA family protein [Kitasatospora sp. NPDC006697]|uniref:Gfo/Idh/MocA family protein n=1 Tax=Kitasatospora sp. NPDC006697 TaxID=3364020 RepID=UPI00369BDEBE